MTTDTPSAEALAEHLTTLWHATGIGSCATAAAMLRSLASERDALRAALSESDRIMGHDEDATEWREKWAHLWNPPATTPPQQEPTA